MRSPFARWPARPGEAPLQFCSAGRTHRGCVRELNEDAILEAPQYGLWAVADGMGGMSAGDVASRAVIDALAAPDQASDRRRHLAEALHRTNARLLDYAADIGAGAVGATVAALSVQDGAYDIAWAGDARGYLLRAGKLERLTRDHSLVQDLVDQGVMTPAEARRSRRRNIVTRAIGADPVLELDLRQGQVAAGDLFLLCSDGLSGVIEDHELAHQLAQGGDLARLADALVELSLHRGAPDNVSLVLVRAEA
ncbi:MAG: protein phosphatase 2C domain-containing protein [Phenylobacterium sp.]